MLNSTRVRAPSASSSISSEADVINEKQLSQRSENRPTSVANSDIDSVKWPSRIYSTRGFSKIPEKIPAHPIRRKSKIEKDDELSKMKLEAKNQIENTIKITDLIKDKESRLSELQSENENLRRDLRRIQSQLNESKNLNRELEDKLHDALHEQAIRKIESENERSDALIDVTLSTKNGYDRYLNDILKKRDQLLEQNNQLRSDLEKSEEYINSMKERMKYLESASKLAESRTIDDSNVDCRSKIEMLKLIRDSMEEKMIWMEYGIKLTREAVERAPQLLQTKLNALSASEVDEFCCTSEAKWASFAITLLEKFNKACPNVLQEIIDSQQSISPRYLNSKMV